jgi:hypothetical protein
MPGHRTPKRLQRKTISCVPASWFRGFQIPVFMVIYVSMADDRW